MFDWDEANLEHIAKHGFDDLECESIFDDEGLLFAEARNIDGEKRQGAIGKTAGGRFSFVIYTLRRGKVRVVSARDATAAQKKRYRNRNG